MKELGIDLSKSLILGLRATPYQGSEPALVECFNAVPEEYGLDPYVRPVSEEDFPEVDWPWPKFFLAGKSIYMATKDKLYLVNGDWSLTELCDANRVQDLADFKDYVVFSGNNQVIVKDVEANTYGSVLADDAFPEFRTCCNFNGQLVVGRFESAWHNTGARFVGWSNIGTSDFTIDTRNEAGYMPVHWNKIVYKVKKLGETVIVYGDNGIGMLFPHEQTFGYKAIADFGLYDEFAITGNEHKHVFLDNAGDLWELLEGKEPVKKGYKEYFSQLKSFNISANYDQAKEHCYFSDGTRTFVYNGRSVFEIGIIPSTVLRVDGYLLGVFDEFDDDDYDFQSDDMLVTVDCIEPQIRAMKTITEVLVGSYAKQQYLYVGAYYRYTHETYTATEWIAASDEGRVRLQLTAPEVQIRIRIKNYSESYDRISRLSARLQYPDGRFRRGIESAS